MIPKFKMSRDEFEALKMKARYPALQVAKNLRLDPNKNSRDRIDFSLTPYHLKPIELMGDPDVQWIYAVAPTQSGKTLLLQVFVADTIDQDPGTMLYVLPDKISGEKQFKEKIITLIQHSPELAAHILQPEKTSLTLKGITLDNMSIYPAWSRSPASLNSNTCIRVVLDEIRLMPLLVKNETNAIEYCEDRITTYSLGGRGQCLGVTTSAVEGDLMHQQIGRPYHQMFWWAYVCQHCNKTQVLDIYENFERNTETGLYLPECKCKFCGEPISDRYEKRELNSNCLYVHNNDLGLMEKEIPPFKKDKSVIFRWVSENSPFRSFKEIAEKYEKCVGDYAAMMNFDQCWRARFHKKSVSKINKKDLLRQSNEIEQGVVPDWCKVITAGIDSQGHGFVFWVMAHGENRRRHLIDAGTLESYAELDSEAKVEKLLRDNFEEKIYKSESKKAWAISSWAIDTGGNRTSQVYGACKNFKKVVLCKGRKIETDIRLSKVEKVMLWLVNTNNYLERSEGILLGEEFTFYKGVTEDITRELCNIRKEKDAKQTKEGEDIYIWKRYGSFDHMMAFLHCLICLDIPWQGGPKLKDRLEVKSFIYNPIDYIYLKDQKNVSVATRIENKKRIPSPHGDVVDFDDDSQYEVGDFSTGGFSM